MWLILGFVMLQNAKTVKSVGIVGVSDRYRECGRPDKGSGIGSHGIAVVIGVVTVSMVIRGERVVRDVVCYCKPIADVYVLVCCGRAAIDFRLELT